MGDFSEAPREDSLELFATLKSAGQLQSVGHVRTSSGERRAVAMSAVASIGAGLHLLVLRDVTDEHAAAESLAWTEEELRRTDARFRAMVEKSAEAIALLSADGKILYITRHSRDLFGIAPEQMVGTDAFAWVTEDDRARVAEAMSSAPRAARRSSFASSITRGRRAGSRRWSPTC